MLTVASNHELVGFLLLNLASDKANDDLTFARLDLRVANEVDRCLNGGVDNGEGESRGPNSTCGTVGRAMPTLEWNESGQGGQVGSRELEGVDPTRRPVGVAGQINGK